MAAVPVPREMPRSAPAKAEHIRATTGTGAETWRRRACPHEHLQVMRLPVVSVLNISEWPARWPYFISLMSVVLRDRGDGLVPSLFGMFPEIGGDASAQVCRCRDVFVLDPFDRFLDDLSMCLLLTNSR